MQKSFLSLLLSFARLGSGLFARSFMDCSTALAVGFADPAATCKHKESNHMAIDCRKVGATLDIPAWPLGMLLA